MDIKKITAEYGGSGWTVASARLGTSGGVVRHPV